MTMTGVQRAKMAEYDNDGTGGNYFARRYIETSPPILGLCTPASRPAHFEQARYPLNAPISTNLNQEKDIISNLNEGEIMKGLHVNDALLPSRRHLIKEVSSLVDYSDNLILSLASLRVLSQISQLYQYEPDPNLAGVAPNRLFSILQEEPGKLESIRKNFRRRLEREETENVQFLADGKDFPHLVSTWLLLNALGEEIERIMTPDFTEAFGLTNYIRLFIVNFFAMNVIKKSFNLAHYILGFASDSQGHEIDPEGCLSLLIDMLMYGLGHPSVEAPVIFVEHPSLGVKLLIFLRALLSAPPQFSNPAREYLRNVRDLFSELAANINTRLLQVSFSSDKGYALSTEFESIRSSDFHFNVFELQQKSELFQILSIDIHEAFTNGNEGLYLEKIMKSLLSCTKEFNGVMGESRIIDFLAAIDAITEDSYMKRLQSRNEGEFERALVLEFESACTYYIESLTMLVGEMLTVLMEFDYEMSKERENLILSLQNWLWKFMRKSTLSEQAIEALVQLVVLINGDAQIDVGSVDALDAQISVLLRPEISSTTRCYLYSAFMRQDSQVISQNLSEDRFLRLVELSTHDASNSSQGVVNDSLVTVALAVLEFLNRARPNLLQDALLSAPSGPFSYSIPTAISSTAPFIPSLLSSLTVDDIMACSLISSTSPSTSQDYFSVFLKWRAKWSFLLNLTIRNETDGEVSSSFAHRFIDGGFLESIIFKFRCLSLNVAYSLGNSGHLVFLAIFPVLKFLCALGMATGRQAAIASRLVTFFKYSDTFDAMTLYVSSNTPESFGSIHAHVIHYILLIFNGFLQEQGNDLGDLSSKMLSFRHAVIDQIIKKSRWVHHIGKITGGSVTFYDEEISERLVTEIQVLQESIDFISRDQDGKDIFAANLTIDSLSTDAFDNGSLSLGNLIFLLKISISKLKEVKERSDFLNYLSRNSENLSPSELEILKNNLDCPSKFADRHEEVLQLQTHLVLLIEKVSFLLLKHLRLKLAPIQGQMSQGISYIDSRSSKVQMARSLKTDASIIILPLLEAYQKNIRLVDSSANTSIYMNTIVRDFCNLLSNQKSTTFEY